MPGIVAMPGIAMPATPIVNVSGRVNCDCTVTTTGMTVSVTIYPVSDNSSSVGHLLHMYPINVDITDGIAVATSHDGTPLDVDVYDDDNANMVRLECEAHSDFWNSVVLEFLPMH